MAGKRLLVPREFGQTLDPPRSARQILNLCREGRVVGAIKPGGNWLIPEGARIKGGGIRTARSKEGLGAREFAEKYGVSRFRVYALLRQGRIEGARKGKEGWTIPEDAPYPVKDF